MHIFLTGAAGFIGNRVLADLLAAGHTVTALASSRSSGSAIAREHRQVTVVYGDVGNAGSISGIVPAGVEAIIYLPGLLREFPAKGLTFEKIHVDGVRNLLAEARRVGARRWIQMSALGASTEGPTPYYRTKGKAEELVRTSGLEWTILRPSVVFDDRPTSRMNFVSELAGVIETAPMIPVFGDGKYRLQPVSLDDVSQTIVQCLTNARSIGKIYEMGGPDVFTYSEILLTIARALGRPTKLLHIPFGLIETVTSFMQRFPFYPLTTEQIVMLKEENIVRDPAKQKEWRTTFTLPMRHFVDATFRYLQHGSR